METIYDIKNIHQKRSKAEIRTDLINCIRKILRGKQNLTDGIIAGCTEIPLVLKQMHYPVPYFDTLSILAKAAIRQAGLKSIKKTI